MTIIKGLVAEKPRDKEKPLYYVVTIHVTVDVDSARAREIIREYWPAAKYLVHDHLELEYIQEAQL